MTVPVVLSNLDYDMNQGLSRPLRDAFKYGSYSALVRGDTEYMYGHTIDVSAFHTGSARIASTAISFQENTPASDTITKLAGGFVAAGFKAGMKVVISGSGSNNKGVTLYSVTDTVLTILSTDDLTAEAVGSSVVIEQLMKTYGLYIAGDRGTAAPQYNDSNAALFKLAHTNYAPNDASFVMRGISMLLNNYTAGTLSLLEGALISVRQRKNSGAITSLRALNLAVELETGGSGPGVVSTQIKGLQVDMRLHGNCPANSAGVEVWNNTDGVYAVPTAAFAVKNAGTSGCVGFTYGMDFYDTQSAAKTWNIAQLRLGKTAAEDVVIVTGNFVDGADSGFAPGSLGLDTTDGLLFMTDSSGLWQQITM